VSWDAQRRINNTIPWKWKGNTWFRMKLTVAVEGDKAHVRAKVWPRDDKEPEKWTLTVEDPTPNRHGSPTLYGFAYGSVPPLSTVHYANVKITPNKSEQGASAR
jgi:hypothetical protein